MRYRLGLALHQDEDYVNALENFKKSIELLETLRKAHRTHDKLKQSYYDVQTDCYYALQKTLVGQYI